MVPHRLNGIAANHWSRVRARIKAGNGAQGYDCHIGGSPQRSGAVPGCDTNWGCFR